MAVFKCKMCGGALEINNNETVATCEYCGTQQTLPKLDDDRRANLYDRANHFRRNNEFDKAADIYEQILNEDNTDAEAYWSLVLCRYGIEYVEDPSSHKRIPTVNRAQFTSIFDDDNYKSALQYADGYQRSIYEDEARAINEIQKGILAISSQEDPFDVFVCYKETDNNGRRTPDSVLAQDLYYQLKQEGFKVFFARITLEDKLGSAYEPYIFAALNSAKVMVVLGTKPEFFKAVWVRNEWSRYLALIKQGQKKMLIPAYKDMDPYDLPEEFSHLQAQDMSKLGFMQDLIRGIKKIAQADAPKTTVVKETVIGGSNANTAPLLKRAFMFLEDGDWNSANEYCEKVLDIDPENASAYLGKLMGELQVRRQEALKEQAKPFDDSNNYQKAIRFADDALKAELIGCIEHIHTRNEHAHLEKVYTEDVTLMNNAYLASTLEKAANDFDSIANYKDAQALAEQCRAKAKDMHKDAMLEKASLLMDGNYLADLKEAASILEEITGWKNADELIITCQGKIEKIEAKEKAERLERERKAELARKRYKRIAVVATPIICAFIAFIIILNAIIIPNGKYNNAIALIDAGNVVEAYETLIALDGYKDSADKANLIFDKYKVEKLKSAKVGDYIIFGAYEQDNKNSNGKEDVEWLILEVKDGKALVISKYALDCKQYEASSTNATWETCTLRKWLNSDFINTAFSTDEKAMIPTVTVFADKNPEYSTNPGNTTQDQVFLLSITEANKYFNSDIARECESTNYAIANGAFFYDTLNCQWWLRSPAYDQYTAALVNRVGSVIEGGDVVYSSDTAVRPALWIDLNA